MSLLKVSDLNKSYYVGDEKLSVLKGVELTVNLGDSLAITGPSGSGKTTLLNILGSLDASDSGTVEFDGTDISGMDEVDRAEFRLNKIGFVFQRHHLLPQCTALENVIMPTVPTKQDRKEVVKLAEELFKKAGLSERMHHFPAQLSGGERQRVAVLRALINKPMILLADEPTGALDKKATQSLLALLNDLNANGMTIIMVTHSEQAATSMKNCLNLDDGVLMSHV